MHRSIVALLLTLMMLPALPSFDYSEKSREHVEAIQAPLQPESFTEPFIHPPLQWWNSFGDAEIKAIVLTEDLSMLHEWQSQNGLLTKQSTGNGTLIRTNPESLQGTVHHRSISLPASMIGKLAGWSA